METPNGPGLPGRNAPEALSEHTLGYVEGNRRAWLKLLDLCCAQLGYHAPETQGIAALAEREEAVLALRRVCAAHGDNDWEDDLDLTDIIESHLEPYLEADAPSSEA